MPPGRRDGLESGLARRRAIRRSARYHRPFPASALKPRATEKSRSYMLKDLVRCSALPLKPAGKLCSRFARGRALCNQTRLASRLGSVNQLVFTRWPCQPNQASRAGAGWQVTPVKPCPGAAPGRRRIPVAGLQIHAASTTIHEP